MSSSTEPGLSSALLEAVFDTAPVGIAFWDLELRYLRVNEALAQINGVTVAGHLGRRPSEFLGEHGVAIEGLLREVLGGGGPKVDRQLTAVLPDGRSQVRAKTLFAVRDDAGAIVGLAGVVRDVTAEVASEAELERLLDEAVAARKRTELLARAGERLTVLTRDYERMLQEVAWIAVPEIADFCIFSLLDRRGRAQVIATAASDPERDRMAIRLAERFVPDLSAPTGTGAALRTGEPQLIREITDAHIVAASDDPEVHDLLRAMQLRSAIVVPMRNRGRVIGSLSLVSAESGRVYDDEDLRLARSLAVRAALAVENARLYTERSHIAQTLQRSLLPAALPDVPGLELAARYRAAGEANEVGGDFYDAFRGADDGTWHVIIGDVSGKGAEAAALTSLTRHTLRAAALQPVDPVEQLALLNAALIAHADPGGRYCTVLATQVRPDARGAEVRMATGGHLPPVVLRADGTIERVALRGALVGGLQSPTFGETRVHLAHDDLLLLFTDGVVELRRRDDHGVEIGDRELERKLRELHGASTEQVVAGVEQHAADLQDGDPRDDIAVVAIRPVAS
jgi:PAS domain S-box-containing protein